MINTYTQVFTNSKPLEKQKLKDIIQIQNHSYNKINFPKSDSYTLIFENPADCGCLLIQNVSDLTDEVQNYIELFMNENGYSKIIGTIAIYKYNKSLLDEIKTLGYTCIKTGESSRHPEENSMTYLIYKVIDPETIGYPS